MSKRIDVTKESSTGRNLKFHDNLTNKDLTRAEFVREIKQGLHPDYHVRSVHGVATPVSNPNGSSSDNLG